MSKGSPWTTSASKAAGRESIPALVRDMSDDEAFGLLMVENLQRDDLHPLEEARAISEMRAQGWTLDQIEAQLGKPARYVARRSKLNDLSADWRARVLDASHPLGRWQAPHLELVARFDPHIQEEILRSLSHDYMLWRASAWTPKDLQEHLGMFLLALSGAPFKAKDPTLVPDAGACDTCLKRSDRQPELWDAEDCGKSKAGVVARCLDKTCWTRKVHQHLLRKEAELRQKHGAVVITTDYHGAEGTPWADTSVREYEVRPCKQGDPGAVPALRVAGPDAGKAYWVQPRDKGIEVTPDGKLKAAKSLKQKRADLARLRQRLVNHAVMLQMEAWGKGEDRLPQVPEDVVLTFVAVVGTRERYQGGRVYADGKWVERTPWLHYADLCAGASRLDLIHTLLRSALLTMVDRFRTGGPLDSIPEQETNWICALFGIDLESLEADAAQQKPEPKSWAKLAETEAAAKKTAKAAKAAVPAEPTRGVCRMCGCTENRACLDNGHPCAWADEEETLCSACERMAFEAATPAAEG